jgi:predicted nucleotidyltransferase
MWLYGSAAGGDDHPGSDLDIAVVAKEGGMARVTGAVRDALEPAGEMPGFMHSVVGL